jgi:formylglycine-generating enzyme required for sulfatase activity
MRFTVSLMLAFFSAAAVQGISIVTVPIGNPGNPADMRYADQYHPNGWGAVAYTFQMGKTEVTNDQYVAFLNSVAASDAYGLYDTKMGSSSSVRGGIIRQGVSGSFTYAVKPTSQTYTYGDKPVIYVNFGDAARFANWLHNGQPTGGQNTNTTEDGAYALNGATANADFLGIARNTGARWFIPSDDEWYKAAFHKNDGTTPNYWDYATRTNSVPNHNTPASDTGNSANYAFFGDPNRVHTGAGAYLLSSSPYGTSDQNGNVQEWNDTIYGNGRNVRGGAWSYQSSALLAPSWEPAGPTYIGDDVGFRVASNLVPEPSTLVLAVSIFAPLAAYRRRPGC